MKIQIWGTSPEVEVLQKAVELNLQELGLQDFIQLGLTNDSQIAKDLGITKDPALIIEEDSIDFKDVIFEGIVPADEELKAMFISIIGGDSNTGGCDTSKCGTSCSC